MAGPITWRNVGTTVNGGGSASLLGGAQRSLDSGFETLNKALERRQETQAKNFDTRQNNMSADYLDRIAQAGSVDELNALRDSEELARLRSGLVGSTRDQIRGAIDKQETNLMAQTGARQQFGDAQWMRNNQDKLAAIEAQAINGDLSGAVSAAEALGIPDAVNVIRGVRDSYNTSADQKIQGDQNARGWNQDARAGELHGTRMTDWQRGQDTIARNEAINRTLVDAAQNSPEGTTLDRQQLIAGLQQRFPDAPMSTWTDLRDNWDLATEGRYGLSASDSTAISQEETALASRYGMNVNPFAQAAQASEDGGFGLAQRVIDKHSQEGGYFDIEGNEDVSRKARNKIMEVVSQGIDVDGRKVPVPEAAIDLALSNSGDAWTEFDHKFDEALKDILEGEQFKGAMTNYAQYQDELELMRLREGQRRSGRPN